MTRFTLVSHCCTINDCCVRYKIVEAIARWVAQISKGKLSHGDDDGSTVQ